jgi:hypothetical protein
MRLIRVERFGLYLHDTRRRLRRVRHRDQTIANSHPGFEIGLPLLLLIIVR